MNTNHFIQLMLVFLTFFLIMVIGSLSLLIRDVKYPIQYPILFTMETLVMGILPASTLFILYHLRGLPITVHILYAFLVFAVKCMIAHVLLQLSGVYSSLFKPTF